MNVLFHVTTAVGIVATLTDTNKINSVKDSLIPGLFAFGCGIFIHGVLDYMPHTYPIAPKVDFVLSLLIIIALIYLSGRKYSIIIGLAFLGSVFPDIVDLLPAILNKYAGLDLPVNDKFFIWHRQEYSGSIFTGHDLLSDINHICVVVLTAVICWFRRADLQRIFKRAK